MTKIRFLSVLAVFFLLPDYNKIYAQGDGMYLENPRLFYGGLVGGANFTQVDGDRFAGYHKIGVNVGGIMYAQLAPQFATSIEILFSQKGSRAHQPNFSVSKAFEIRAYQIDLNYAEIPILFNYFDRRKSHFGAGFSYSQLISSKEVVESSIGPINTDDFPFRKSDLNLVLSGNLHLVQGLFLNARFQYSIYSIRKTFHPELGRAQQFNNLWALRLMYIF